MCPDTQWAHNFETDFIFYSLTAFYLLSFLLLVYLILMPPYFSTFYSSYPHWDKKQMNQCELGLKYKCVSSEWGWSDSTVSRTLAFQYLYFGLFILTISQLWMVVGVESNSRLSIRLLVFWKIEIPINVRHCCISIWINVKIRHWEWINDRQPSPPKKINNPRMVTKLGDVNVLN